MTIETHLWDCRYSRVDCEAGCNCYNEDNSRCERYESRVKVCPDCGTEYDVEAGCSICAINAEQTSQAQQDRRANMFKIRDGRARFHLLFEGLTVSDEETKALLESVQGLIMMTPRLAVIEVARHEEYTPTRILQAKQEIRGVLLGKEEPFIPALLNEDQRSCLDLLTKLARGLVAGVALLENDDRQFLREARHAIETVEEELIGG